MRVRCSSVSTGRPVGLADPPAKAVPVFAGTRQLGQTGHHVDLPARLYPVMRLYNIGRVKWHPWMLSIYCTRKISRHCVKGTVPLVGTEFSRVHAMFHGGPNYLRPWGP